MNKIGKHRTRLEIIANILSVISDNNGLKKTQIMYQAFLSYKLLIQYLNDVMEAGLVMFGSENCYKITQKGQEYLDKFHDYCNHRDRFEKLLDYVEDKRGSLEKMCPQCTTEQKRKPEIAE